MQVGPRLRPEDGWREREEHVLEVPPRNGQPAALALDAVAPMDALRIDKAVIDVNRF